MNEPININTMNYDDFNLSQKYETHKELFSPSFFNDYQIPNLYNNSNIINSEKEKDNLNQKNFLNKKTKRTENNNNEEFKQNSDSFEYNNKDNDNYKNSVEFHLLPSIITKINMNNQNMTNNFHLVDNINKLRFQVESFKQENDKKTKEKKEKNSQCGRKTYEQKKIGTKGLHTKDSEDNTIYKIKAFFWKSLYEFIKNSFIEEKDLLKSDNKINRCLKKDFNEKLFKRRLKDIFYETKISKKYKHKNPLSNKEIISHVYKENQEKAVIKILELTYIEAFDIFRRKIINPKISSDINNKIEGTNFLDITKFRDVEVFLNEIEKKEIKNKEKEEDIIEYKANIKNLILNFEKWFANKNGRNR